MKDGKEHMYAIRLWSVYVPSPLVSLVLLAEPHPHAAVVPVVDKDAMEDAICIFHTLSTGVNGTETHIFLHFCNTKKKVKAPYCHI